MKQPILLRGSSLVVAASLLVPLASGCGSPAPPATTTQGGTTMQRPASNTGLNTKQKVVLLAGAAALYYYYNRSKKANAAAAQGKDIQYYLSKSTGRVYYRDPQNPKKVTWVTPPPSEARPVQLPASEASQYSGFRGYDNSTTGYGLEEKFPVQ